MQPQQAVPELLKRTYSQLEAAQFPGARDFAPHEMTLPESLPRQVSLGTNVVALAFVLGAATLAHLSGGLGSHV